MAFLRAPAGLLIVADVAAQVIGVAAAFCFNGLSLRVAAFSIPAVEAVGEDVFPIIRK